MNHENKDSKSSSSSGSDYLVTKGILTNVTVSKKAILSYRVLKVKIKYSWSFTQHEILGMKEVWEKIQIKRDMLGHIFAN